MDKKRPFRSGVHSLSTWLMVGIGGFVVFGSVTLAAYFHHLTLEEEEKRFASLASNNARFVDQARLSRSQLLAERLGIVMGAKVEFRDSGKSAGRGSVWTEDEVIHAVYPLRNGGEVRFSRDLAETGYEHFWERWDFWMLMAGFWGLSLLLAWWLARRVTKPLSLVAGAIPKGEGDWALDQLPEEGPVEVLALAEALRKNHREILSEREKRRRAERLAILGKMAASLAHEVKNPVAAIRLHGQLLAREVSGSAGESARLMVDEADRIEFLLGQWMNFAKPEPSLFSEVDLLPVLHDVTAALEPQAKHADVSISLVCDSGTNDHRIRGDRVRLTQVFRNLLLNAIQAMPRGGAVEVRVLDGMLEIADQGTGFSEAALENAVDPFYSEREGGMGLGLAVSKEILQSHGATISIQNRKTGGALVRISWGRNKT